MKKSNRVDVRLKISGNGAVIGDTVWIVPVKGKGLIFKVLFSERLSCHSGFLVL